MKLPLQHPVDIYQIHRTIFFKRIHRYDSDQFERLKKAYESIRSFDDKPLEIQFKKERLENLLRRIKGRKENKPRPRNKSKQQIRVEELSKARQLGIEYSRKNYNSTPRISGSKNFNFNFKEDWLEKKSQLNRRLDYGNRNSNINRSKIQRSQEMHLTNGKVFPTFSRAPKSAVREKLRKLLVHYLLSENNPDPDVVNSFEEIAETKNHLYWDLMGAIEKQQQFIKRYDKFTKRLSKFVLRNVKQNQSSHVEIFNSKTNIRRYGSEILIKTYRYSDEAIFLPPPSESLLRIPSNFSGDEIIDEMRPPSKSLLRKDSFDDDTDEIPTRDELNNSSEELESGNNLIKHLHLTLPNIPSKIAPLEQKIPEKSFDLSQKFAEIIRKTARRESENMLTNLEKAMKH